MLEFVIQINTRIDFQHIKNGQVLVLSILLIVYFLGFSKVRFFEDDFEHFFCVPAVYS